MTLTGSFHRAPAALSLIGGAFVASCVLDLTGTGTGHVLQEAGVDQDAGAQGVAASCVQTHTPDELTLLPAAPAALILLDHSSSMFEYGFWEPVKASLLEAVQRFENEVRFGLATYTGEHAGECPALRLSAEPAQNNAVALGLAYEQLEAPAFKGETPTAAALSQMAQMLAGDRHSGAKFILLVTDGDPDFCDDGDPSCARDAVVAAAQAAYARGITTLVFRVGSLVASDHLADVANAGSGQPVARRRSQETCPGASALYSQTGGDAQFYDVIPAGTQAADAISAVIASIRGCVFEVRGPDQLDAAAIDAALLEIDGRPAARGAPDGFRMNTPTQLELLGASCQRWRAPDAQIALHTPCQP